MFNHTMQDLSYGLRTLLARPGFAFVTILTLGLAIGAHTTLFGVVHALLLSPVQGIGAPDRLVEIGRTHNGEGMDTISYPDFLDYSAAKSLDGTYAYSPEALNVTSSGDPHRALGLLVSGSYFSTLRVPPELGRVLSAIDDTDAAPPVAVASYAAWQKYFNADPAAVGKTVSINGHVFTLIGVAAHTFNGQIAVLAPEFYLPLHNRTLLREGSKDLLSSRKSLWLMTGARLHDGVDVAQAQAELATIKQRLDAEYGSDDKKSGIGVAPLRGVPTEVRGPLGAFSGLLFAMVGMILLVACVNVAGLLIARGETRRQEIAVRFALGASRGRVFFQLFAENLWLALGAGTLGILLATWWRDLLLRVDVPTPFPVSPRIPFDGSVFAFALLLTAATALLFGALPTLRASKQAPATGGALVADRTSSRGSRLREGLVVVQIALTLVLLIGSGLFVRALERAAAIDIGFDANHVVSMDFDLEPSGYDEAHRARLQTALLERVRTIGGVEQAALASILPLSFNRMSIGCVHGAGFGKDELCPDVNLVSDGFFATLGMSLRGRGFDTHDVAGGTNVAVVNETLAKRLAPDGDALGRSFAYGEDKDARTLTIVGVVPDGKYSSLGEDKQPFLFLPLAQSPSAMASLLVRSAQDSPALARALADAVREVDRSLPVAQTHPLADTLALSLLPQRIAGLVAGALGALGLLLAAIGLYGLIAFHVASRTREIGIRLSLGAAPRRVLRDVLWRGGRLVGIGLVAGEAIGVGLAVLVSGLLFGAQPGDVLAFAAAGLVLGLVALPACYVPARAAVRIDPAVALRHD
ncbi:MAG: ABC transporter permease [Rudaea sp.]|uniref:ABC transporter permease n=1 Tax=Rudaea sp. TaxID=2136325 RepID=UPI0039E2BAEC